MAQRKKRAAREPSHEARDDQLTVGDLVAYVAPSIHRSQAAPIWPPDAFAVAASILKKSDGYARAARTGPVRGRARWRAKMAELGAEWRRTAVEDAEPPAEIRKQWRAIVERNDLPLTDVPDDREFATALLDLCTAADEASAYAGLPGAQGDDRFAAECRWLLLTPNRPSLCREIHPSRAVVLPKLHTPQVGLTLRSITHHLALWDSGEVEPEWVWTLGPALAEPKLNVLFLPWPQEIWPSQIRSARRSVADKAAEHGYFTCDSPLDGKGLFDAVEKAVVEATKKVGPVDVVLFPELALAEGLTSRLCAHLNERSSNAIFVVAGEGSSSQPRRLGVNRAVVAVPEEGYIAEWTQAKHHRWKIDGSQIATYGLGSQLDPTINWWEDIELPRRRLRFCSLNEWLTFSVLICEDLARQEPVGELLRTVGPTLVLALLMDGPQLESRWAARYASVLADDPGSSVLSVTSFGMVNLSHAPGKPPSRVVALWKEAGRATREISLPPGASGLVLSLTRDEQRELTADGRTQGKQTGYLRLHGVHPV